VGRADQRKDEQCSYDNFASHSELRRFERCNLIFKSNVRAFSKMFESFQRQTVSTVNTALATLTGAVYNDSPRNDPDFSVSTGLVTGKTIRFQSPNQNNLKAFCGE
jgi:hypothetical protein